MREKRFVSFLIFFIVVGMIFLLSCKKSQIEEPIDIERPTLISPKNEATLDNGCYYGEDKKIWDFDWSDVQQQPPPGYHLCYHLYVKHVGSDFPVIDIFVDESHYHSEDTSYISDSNRLHWKWKVRTYMYNNFGSNQSSLWTIERTFNVEPACSD